MGFIEAVMMLPVAAGLLAIYSYITSGSNGISEQVPVSHRKHPRFRLLRHTEVVMMYDSHLPHLLFYVDSGDTNNPNADQRPQALAEFIGTLPWIPGGTSIFLVAENGFSSSMLQHLEGLNSSRLFYLVEGRQDAELLIHKER